MARCFRSSSIYTKWPVFSGSLALAESQKNGDGKISGLVSRKRVHLVARFLDSLSKVKLCS